MDSESAGFAGFAGFVSDRPTRPHMDKWDFSGRFRTNPANPANPALHRCRVCGGIVAPFHRYADEPCQSSCLHEPDLHAACRHWPNTGIVYGPAEPPAGYTIAP